MNHSVVGAAPRRRHSYMPTCSKVVVIFATGFDAKAISLPVYLLLMLGYRQRSEALYVYTYSICSAGSTVNSMLVQSSVKPCICSQ
jgi:hypothetical protein